MFKQILHSLISNMINNQFAFIIYFSSNSIYLCHHHIIFKVLIYRTDAKQEIVDYHI